jgi:anti-anti-sigma regulatory factor
MTCRIDRRSAKKGLLLQISGRLASEDLNVVRTALDGHRVVIIELSEVDLIDLDAVRLLAQAEADGIELKNCPAYIREWISKERTSG